jgi:two-component system, sensor histidine kinase and response regulator
MTFDQTEKKFLCIDDSIIKVVIRNLLSNAIKFTPNGGKIEIGILNGGTETTIYVKDSGMGVSEDRINKIFEQSKTTNGTETEKGNGFGLFICKELIEIHKGRIWVESETEIGSIFLFSIPNFLKI